MFEGASLWDVYQLLNPWIALASSTLIIQEYQSLLSRVGYIALLLYYYIFKSRDPTLLTQVLPELYRSKKAKGGETDDFGKHWTLNLADQVVLTVFGQAFFYCFPGYQWTGAAIVVFLTLFVLGHHLVQLWMQTQIAKLVRFNSNVWRWRGWFIDSTLLSSMKRIDFPVTRAIYWAFWWLLYQALSFLTHERMAWVRGNWIVLRVWARGHPTIKSLSGWSTRLLICQFFFQGLGKFTNPDPSEHKYTPLKEPEHIRVILLYPRFGFAKICCSLLQGPHMRILLYEAISYNWGVGDMTEEILIDGCRRKVTKSVYEIFTSHSSLFLPKLLWIDAICIDQKNDVEKSQQVPLMDKIYRSAIITTVYLGQSPLPENKNVPLKSAMEFRYDGLISSNKVTRTYFEDARLVYDLLNEFHVLQGNALRRGDLELYQTFEYLKLSKAKRRQWGALFKMLEHPWFERVWVIQEVALSRKVQVRYGDEIIDWDLLADGVVKLIGARHFALWLELEHKVPIRHIQYTSLNNISRMNRFRSNFRPLEYSWNIRVPLTLPDVLKESLYFKATDPRDLIFGLMSMCKTDLKVDYALSVEEVYLNVAKNLFDEKNFHLLLHAAGIGNRLERPSPRSVYPSWVPDWTDSPKYNRLLNLNNQRTSGEFTAGGKGKSAFSLKSDNTLNLTAICIDIIDDLAPPLFDTSRQGTGWTVDEMHQLATNHNLDLGLLENSRVTDPYMYARGQSLALAFRRVLILDRHNSKWGASSDALAEVFIEWEAKLETFRGETLEISTSMSRDALYELLKSMDELTEVIKSCCGGRKLFVSGKGYIGLCPPYAKKGDLIYTVPGFHVPLLMRRESEMFGPLRPGASRKVRFVGEGFVYGLMSGEGMSLRIREEGLEIV